MAKVETLTGWIARDEFCNSKKETPGTLCLYPDCPERDNCSALGGFWDSRLSECIELPKTMFPEITWKDEPVYVKLSIEVLK